MWPVYTAEKASDLETEAGFLVGLKDQNGNPGMLLSFHFEYEHRKTGHWKYIEYWNIFPCLFIWFSYNIKEWSKEHI